MRNGSSKGVPVWGWTVCQCGGVGVMGGWCASVGWNISRFACVRNGAKYNQGDNFCIGFFDENALIFEKFDTGFPNRGRAHLHTHA